MSGSFSTAIAVWVWNRRSDYHHAVLTEHIRNSAEAWTQYQAQLAAHGITGVRRLRVCEFQVISGQASTLAVNDVFNVLGVLFLLLIPLVWFAKPPFGARAANPAH